MTPPGRQPALSLLESLQRLIERTYRMETGIVGIGRYVIGDEGYRLFYLSPGRGGAPSGSGRRQVAGQAGGRARVLVHDAPGTVAAHIYFPDALIRNLEQYPPTRGLGEENVDGFATFVEEIDHLLLIAERARLGRPVSLLELEMHANVTKYLVCALFLARGRRGEGRGSVEPEDRLWLRWHLFEKAEFAEADPEVQCRYRDASCFAHRFLDRLESAREASARLALLRAFHDSSHQGKLASLA